MSDNIFLLKNKIDQSRLLSTFLIQLLNNIDKKNFENLGNGSDYSIDTKGLKNFFQSKIDCAKEYYTLMQFILESTKYVTSEEAKETYNKNTDNIASFIQDNTVIMVIPNFALIKSNIFFILYTLYLLRQKNIEIENIEMVLADSRVDYNFEDGKKYMLVFTDDFCYSGSQLLNDVIKQVIKPDYRDFPEWVTGEDKKDNSHKIPMKRTYNENIQCYLNIIGWTERAKNNITGYFLSDEQGKNSIYNNFDNFVKINNEAQSLGMCLSSFYEKEKTISINVNKTDNNEFIFLYDLLKVKKEFGAMRFESSLSDLFDNQKTSLIYLFTKYPDEVSTYNHLCRIENYNGERIDIQTLIQELGMPPGDYVKMFHDYDQLDGFIKYGISTNPEIIKQCNPENKNSFIDTFKTVDNRTDKCDDSIKSFYKEIDYKLDDIEINKTIDILELMNNYGLLLESQKTPEPPSKRPRRGGTRFIRKPRKFRRTRKATK